MRINLYNIDRVFVLGAGASAEYGLPMWKDLPTLIKEELNDSNANFNFKNEIIEWLEKIGNGIYGTIDECVTKESASEKYRKDGDNIEIELWGIIKSIFSKKYNKETEIDSWILSLNNNIIKYEEENKLLAGGLFFVNFNYDHVLTDRFLKDNTVPEKTKNTHAKSTVDKMEKTIVASVCPHASFVNRGVNNHIRIDYNTIKSAHEKYQGMEVVSCFDNNKTIDLYTSQTKNEIDLFIIGLGSGLEFNLNKIEFKNDIHIRNIFITITNPERNEEIKEFLASKFSIEKDKVFIYKMQKA